MPLILSHLKGLDPLYLSGRNQNLTEHNQCEGMAHREKNIYKGNMKKAIKYNFARWFKFLDMSLVPSKPLEAKNIWGRIKNHKENYGKIKLQKYEINCIDRINLTSFQLGIAPLALFSSMVQPTDQTQVKILINRYTTGMLHRAILQVRYKGKFWNNDS